MAYVLLSDRFYSALPVLQAGHRLIGIWIRMASYQAAYPAYGIHPYTRKMFGARPKDIASLIELGFIVETPEGWRLGKSDLWRISA